MCAICGQFDFSGSPADTTLVARMATLLRHRGPDGEGIYVDGAVALGHRRLSILDLTDSGRQPMSSPDGSVQLVFNGELYNFRELRASLEQAGETFTSHSDTEVLVRLYQREGVRCLEKLRGMFAFALWDARERQLLLARDRAGIKPLYYAQDSASLWFASEIKALLLVPRVDRTLDPGALLTYLSYGHSFAPQTIYRGVRKVPPGHFMLCDANGAHLHRYWDVPDREEQGGDLAASASHVRDLLADAVRAHMVSDVPVGAFLSGGLDSGAVVAFMSQATKEAVRTFSIGFDVGGAFNELDDGRRISRAFHTQHAERIVTDMDAESLLRRLVWHYDEPFADPAALPTLLLAEFAREHVKVALSGEGGDEVFGGYRRYQAELLQPLYSWLPRAFRAGVMNRFFAPGSSLRRSQKALEAFAVDEPVERYAVWFSVFRGDTLRDVLGDAARSHAESFDPAAPFSDAWSRRSHGDSINRLLYTDFKTWLPDTYLEKVDKATMAVGLEARVPFLDHRLVESVFALPGDWKVRRRATKFILREALRGVLPSETLSKPKHGFSVPLDAWFRGKLKSLAAETLLDSASDPWLDRTALERLFRRHQSGDADFGTQLWTLVCFRLWQQLQRDAASPPPAAVAQPAAATH